MLEEEDEKPAPARRFLGTHLHTLTFPPSRLLGREDLMTDDDEEIDNEVDIQDEEQTKKELKSLADMLEARRKLARG